MEQQIAERQSALASASSAFNRRPSKSTSPQPSSLPLADDERAPRQQLFGAEEGKGEEDEESATVDTVENPVASAELADQDQAQQQEQPELLELTDGDDSLSPTREGRLGKLRPPELVRPLLSPIPFPFFPAPHPPPRRLPRLASRISLLVV